MARKKKVVPNITITGVGEKGKGVGRDATGKVVFVQDVVPGDVVDVLVLRNKGGYRQGIVKDFVQLSPSRIAPFCEHFGLCGGCNWQHLPYETQLQIKEQMVRDALMRIAKINSFEFIPILASEKTTYYRNKLEFSFSNRRWLTHEELNTDISNNENVLGFHKSGTFGKLVSINHCHLQGGLSNDIRNKVRYIAHKMNLSFYDFQTHEGFLRNMIVRTSTLEETMLIFSMGYEDQELRETFLTLVLEEFPEINSIYYCINEKVNDFILDLDHILYRGTP